MGVRGVRRGNADKQIHAQLQDAANALLAVMKILDARKITTLSDESLSLLAATERRAGFIRERIAALESARGKVEG